MTAIKIEHADPLSSRALAFDVLRDPPKKGDDPVVERTIVLSGAGKFAIVDMGRGLSLREVSAEELKHRDDVAAEVERKRQEQIKKEQDERAEAQAKAAKEQADKIKQEADEQLAAESGEYKAAEGAPKPKESAVTHM